MSSPAQVSQYGPYIDLQNFTGSAAPSTSGSLWLSGANASERVHSNVGLVSPKLKLASTVEVVGILDEDNMASDSATNLATQQSIKAYVDALVTAQDLDFVTDSGSGNVDLDSQSLTLAGSSGLDVTHSGQTVTYALDLNELSAITATDDTDQISVVDATDNSTKKITRANLFGAASAGFSSGLTATTVSGSGAATFASTLTVQGNILPLVDNGCDLGASGTEFKDAFFDGTVTTDALVADTADIDAGTIDGTAIGGSSQSTAKFTTVSGSGAATFASTVTAQGNILPLNDDEVDLGSSSKQFKDLYIDGAAYIDALGEALNCASQAMTNVNIDSGNIDGVAIGASSQGAGSFTTVSASSTLSVTGISRLQGDVHATGSVYAGGSFVIGSAAMSEADLEKLDGITNGTAAAGKALVLDSNGDIGTINAISASYAKIGTLDVNTINSVAVTQNALEVTDYKIVSALSASSANSDAGGFQIGGGAGDDGLGSVVWNDTLQSLELMSGSTTAITLGGATTTAILPGANNTWSLGNSTNQFKDLYIDGSAYIDTLGEALDANGQNITNVATFEVDGVATFNGNVTLGDAAADVITATGQLTGSQGLLLGDDKALHFGADEDAYIKYDSTNFVLAVSGAASGTVLAGNFLPSADNSWDLGGSGVEWKNLYIDGTANIDTLLADAGTLTVGAISTLNGAMDCDNQNMTNVDIDSGAIDGTAIGGASAAAGTFTTLDCTDGAFAVDNLDIDGATDIGAALTTSDLFMVDDGAAGVNRKSTLERVVTLMESEIDALGAVTFSGNVTVGSNGSGMDVKFFGTAANEYVLYDASEHTMQWVDSGGSAHVTIGGDSASEFAVDVVQGSDNKNKIRAASFVTYSDERLKKDVSPMQNALETVNSLSAVNFTWKKGGAKDFGFMAQDLKKVVPEAVHGTDEGMFGVDYGRLTAVLVSAIQEQSAQIKDLQAKLNKK